MTISIQKWGNSQGIRLPKLLLDSMGWSETEKLNVTEDNGRIIIEKAAAETRKNIKELFEDYDGGYTPEEIDWGTAEGNEIW